MESLRMTISPRWPSGNDSPFSETMRTSLFGRHCPEDTKQAAALDPRSTGTAIRSDWYLELSIQIRLGALVPLIPDCVTATRFSAIPYELCRAVGDRPQPENAPANASILSARTGSEQLTRARKLRKSYSFRSSGFTRRAKN